MQSLPMVWTMWNIESNFLFSTRPSGDEHPKGYNAFTPHLGSGLQSTNIHFLFEKRREQKKYIESVYFSMTRSAYEKKQVGFSLINHPNVENC